MSNSENKKKKTKVVGAIALSAVLASGLGYGTYNAVIKDSSNDTKQKEDGEKRDAFSKKRDSDSSFKKNKEVEKDLDERNNKERDLSHLEEVAVKEAEEQEGKEFVAGRNLDHLEEIALKHAKETEMNIKYTKDDKGRLALENTDEENKNLIVSINPEIPSREMDNKEEVNLDDVNTEQTIKPDHDYKESEDPVQVAPEKPELPEMPNEPNPEQPEKPNPEPEKPVPEQPEKPSPEPKPNPEPTPEPEKPKDPEPEKPVITTDVIYKTDFIPYKTIEIEDSSLEKGERDSIQKGKNGERVTKFKVTYKDGKEVKREVLERNEVSPINEIVLVGTKDLDGLKSLVNKVKNLEESDYTEETWNFLLENITNAEKVLNDKDSTQKQVDVAKQKLEDAFNNLELVVDYSGLELLVTEAENLEGELYSEETWNVLLERLANAKEILNDEDATQEQIDIAKEQLESAINGLGEVESENEEDMDEENNDQDDETNDDQNNDTVENDEDDEDIEEEKDE